MVFLSIRGHHPPRIPELFVLKMDGLQFALIVG